MKLLKDLWVLSNNHLSVLKSVPICFPLPRWQLGFTYHVTSIPGHPVCHHVKKRFPLLHLEKNALQCTNKSQWIKKRA